MLVEEVPDALEQAAGAVSAELALLTDVAALAEQVQPTGIGELDRVLGGGLVPGSVTLLGGEPGITARDLLDGRHVVSLTHYLG